MAVTIVCADCGHAKRSEDGEEETCPKCEGTMAPPKKKPAAKADDTKSAKKKPARDEDDEDEKPAAKKKPARDEDDDEDERPKAKKKSRDDDDEDDDEDEKPKGKKKSRGDDDKGEGYILNPDPAENLELRTGFKNSKLMEQVTDELSRGETLFWAGRMCPEIVEQKAKLIMFVGIGVALVGCVFSGIFLAVMKPWFVGLVPLIFVIIGLCMAVFLPKATRKAAAIGWYAVTDQRAIVFTPGLFGKQGKAESYEPDELRRMRVKPAKRPKGAGDLIFKTKITETRTNYVDRKTGRTVRSETSRHETHYGFLGIEDVREVEALIHKVLLSDEDEDEDEKPRKKKRDEDDDDE